MAKYPTPPGDGLEPLVRELKDIRRQLRDLQRPSGTNIGNTAAQVQLQIAYLASLQTLSATDSAITWAATPFIPIVDSGATLTVTTTEPLRVRVSYSAKVYVYPRGGTSAYSTSFYVGSVALNGVQIGPDTSAGSAASAGVGVENEIPYFCDRIVTVPAGVNVFTHRYRPFAYAASGGETGGDRSDGVLVVQILGRP